MVDGFVWKGSSDATVVQRVGIAIFGLVFLVCAFMFAYLALRASSKSALGEALLMVLFTLFCLAVGYKVLRNAFLR
jgi:hypothetical protein